MESTRLPQMEDSRKSITSFVEDDQEEEHWEAPRTVNGNGKDAFSEDWNVDEAYSSEEYGEIDENGNREIEKIDIWSIPVTTEEKARELAKEVIRQLEADLFRMYQHNLIRKNSDMEIDRQKRRRLLSLDDIYAEALKRGPLEIFYTKDKSHQTTQPKEGSISFKSSQAMREKTGYSGTCEKFTQTREFAFISVGRSRDAFLGMFPDTHSKHVEPPSIPSRQTSLQAVVNKSRKKMEPLAVGAKPDVKVAPLKKLLPPLPKEVYKSESYWTGSHFCGKFDDNTFSHGKYTYPMGTTYESEFKKGELHSKKHWGLITYPRGDRFEGNWANGRYLEGKITFSDGLEYDPLDWSYCSGEDRRFYSEKFVGLQGVGETFRNNTLPHPEIPMECFDVGDGVYDPKTRKLSTYSGVYLREASEFEHWWILCNFWKRKTGMERYVGSFMDDRPPDLYASNVPKEV